MIHMHSYVSHVNKRVLILTSRRITSASEFIVASDLDHSHLFKQQVMSQPHANQKSWNFKTTKQAYQVNAFNNSSQTSKPPHKTIPNQTTLPKTQFLHHYEDITSLPGKNQPNHSSQQLH